MAQDTALGAFALAFQQHVDLYNKLFPLDDWGMDAVPLDLERRVRATNFVESDAIGTTSVVKISHANPNQPVEVNFEITSPILSLGHLICSGGATPAQRERFHTGQ